MAQIRLWFGGVLLTVSLLVVGCSGSASKSTSIPMPEIMPDLVNAMPVLEDLPPGFERASGAMFRAITSGFATNQFGMEPDNIFAFEEPTSATFVQGTAFLLTTERQRTELNADLVQPDRFLSSMIEGMIGWDPANDVREQRILREPQGIGDQAAAVNAMVSWQGNDSLRFEAVIFRRTDILAFVLVYYRDGTAPNIKAEDLARSWDQRLVSLLADPERAEVLKPKDADSFNGRGLVYALRGDLRKTASKYIAASEMYAQAVSEYDAAIAQRSDYGDAYLNRGIAQALRSQRREAIEDFRMAYRLGDKVDTREEAAQHLRSLGEEP